MNQVLNILGYGLSGFGFLLMYFAYKLLDKSITVANANLAVLKNIKFFMILCFLMTIAVGIFSYITGTYKTQQITNQSQTIQKQKESIKNITDISDFNQKIATSNLTDFNEIQQAQNSLIKTIDKSIGVKDDSAVIANFKKQKEISTTIADTLAKISTSETPEVVNNIKKRLILSNNNLIKIVASSNH